jgi:hypothetical protein
LFIYIDFGCINDIKTRQCYTDSVDKELTYIPQRRKLNFRCYTDSVDKELTYTTQRRKLNFRCERDDLSSGDL